MRDLVLSEIYVKINFHDVKEKEINVISVE